MLREEFRTSLLVIERSSGIRSKILRTPEQQRGRGSKPNYVAFSFNVRDVCSYRSTDRASGTNNASCYARPAPEPTCKYCAQDATTADSCRIGHTNPGSWFQPREPALPAGRPTKPHRASGSSGGHISRRVAYGAGGELKPEQRSNGHPE